MLIIGAELLVRGASSLAFISGVSPLVVGLTVVAYGTSAPEVMIGIQSALNEQTDVTLGNIIGTNIFNVLFVLGFAAMVVPLQVSPQLIRFDVPLMIMVSVLFLFLSLDGTLSRVEGGLLVSVLLGYTVWTVVKSRSVPIDDPAAPNLSTSNHPPRSKSVQIVIDLGFLVAGLGCLVIGSEWFLQGAVSISRSLGVSELVIGLTIVAAGTSMPEVVTCVMAGLRGERDLAVGNIVGSSMFNILGVLGITSLVAANGIPVSEVALRFDIPVMIAVAFLCLPIFYTGHLISRWEAGLFLAYYAIYTASVVASATNPQLNRIYATIVLGVAIPVTILAMILGVLQSSRLRSASTRSEIQE